MKKYKPMTDSIRRQISERRKSKMDIADLIRDVEIKGEDLSYSYISELNAVNRDVSDCNFTGTTMKFMGQNCIARNARFIAVVLLPGSSLRGADLRRSNFLRANCGYIDYAYADLRGANICGAVVSLASRLGFKAVLSENIFEMLKKWWVIKPGDPMQTEGSD